MGDYFEKRELPAKTKAKRQSSLALQMEQFAGSPNNPFMEYAKFDGTVSLIENVWLL